MFIEPKPFPYLHQREFVGDVLGNIIFFEDSVPEDKRDWLRKEYKKWWQERQEEYYRKDKMLSEKYGD